MNDKLVGIVGLGAIGGAVAGHVLRRKDNALVIEEARALGRRPCPRPLRREARMASRAG
jgi:hypothetical protein